MLKQRLHSLGLPESTGNLGIDDQRMAMKWVKDHIAAFRGDGERVTTFGQSAGAAYVLHHLLQSPSRGLYSKVPTLVRRKDLVDMLLWDASDYEKYSLRARAAVGRR